MVNLASVSTIRELLSRFEISPLKQLGQNFLCDAHMLAAIADSAELDGGKSVLEIGPGLGALTQQLALRAGKVVAVEIDKGLLPVLEYTLADFSNVEVIHGDILKQDLHQLHEKLGGGAFAVCANLPYYITTPIIMNLLESGLPITTLSFLIQKEVAERMAARPGSKNYGSLSIAVQYYTDVEIVTKVPPTCFVPQPGVDSIVVRLRKKAAPGVSVPDEELFFALTRCAFAMRRKTLANNIAASSLGLTREQAQLLLENCGLSPTVRGEALSLAEFGALAGAVWQFKNR
jgi:16S rRNA (adenine1518-N6/adenine1519-N6)-dimethyltransferase